MTDQEKVLSWMRKREWDDPVPFPTEAEDDEDLDRIVEAVEITVLAMAAGDRGLALRALARVERKILHDAEEEFAEVAATRAAGASA